MNSTVIQSIVRAIGIMKCFENAEELGVTEISNMTGLHKSTAFNIISTLEKFAYLEKDQRTCKYRLGIELFRMGTLVNCDLRRTAMPYLERLVDQFQETVNLVARDREHIVYLEKIESPHSMRISTAVGSRAPIYATAVGKAILSGMPDEELSELLSTVSFVRLTDYTVCDKGKLMDSIRKGRELGYFRDNEELEIGLSCVAAPIFNHTGKAVAAISIAGPVSRMKEEFAKDIGISLVKITKEISSTLGYKTK